MGSSHFIPGRQGTGSGPSFEGTLCLGATIPVDNVPSSNTLIAVIREIVFTVILLLDRHRESSSGLFNFGEGGRFVPRSEQGTNMSVFRPVEDFLNRSLGVLTSIFDRLGYLADLRENDGTYYHWGMIRKYGQQKAASAIAEAHTANFLEFLRTPIWTLEAELGLSAKGAGLSPDAYTRTLLESETKLAAANPGGGSALHFKSALQALAALESSTPPASSQSQPPGQQPRLHRES